VSNRYTPLPVSSNTEQLPRYLQDELRRLSEIINNISDGHFDVSHSEPDKPRTGDIRYADGSDWNPGSTGEGLYIYLSTGAWSKL
jgi:hypothetical protein